MLVGLPLAHPGGVLKRSTNIAKYMSKIFSIHYDESAEQELTHFRANVRRRILDDVDSQLCWQPAVTSRRRKVLESLVPPWDQDRPVWQLTVGEYRVFYDVDEDRYEVIVRAVRRKGRRSTEEVL
jgi:mRNA-degrading endonuclease RelE of RelBE toxin-antitoxin system